MPRRSIYSHATTLEIVLTAAGVAVVRGFLIWISTLKALEDNGTWRILLEQFGSLLIATATLAFLWDLVGKRALASEIFDVARIGADVRNAALVRIGTSYLEDVEWEGYFATVEKLDVFVAYGATWRGTNTQRLRTVAAKDGTRIRVYLPDPNDGDLVSRLGLRFNMSPDDVKRRIIEAKDEFIGLRQEGGGDVIVHYHSGDPVFSCYRFDRLAILTLYSHTRDRAGVPTIVCRDGGTLYDFVRDELRAIENQSQDADAIEAEGPAGVAG